MIDDIIEDYKGESSSEKRDWRTYEQHWLNDYDLHLRGLGHWFRRLCCQ